MKSGCCFAVGWCKRMLLMTYKWQHFSKTTVLVLCSDSYQVAIICTRSLRLINADVCPKKAISDVYIFLNEVIIIRTRNFVGHFSDFTIQKWCWCLLGIFCGLCVSKLVTQKGWKIWLRPVEFVIFALWTSAVLWVVIIIAILQSLQVNYPVFFFWTVRSWKIKEMIIVIELFIV